MAIIGSLPYTLTNGQTADATQVMADLNAIVNGANANAAAITSVQQNGYNYAADTGTVNNPVIAMSPSPASYTDGLRGYTKASNTNTSSTMTVKFGSLGTKSVVIDQAGTLPPIACFISGMHYAFEYDSTQDKAILVNPSRATGSFTGTITTTYLTVQQTGTINYANLPDGLTVQVWIPSAITGISNSTSLVVSGIPAAIQSASDKRVPIGCEDAGAYAPNGRLSTGSASSSWTMFNGLTSTTWTNTATTKGLLGGSFVTYAKD